MTQPSKDIRLQVGIADHFKTRRLVREAGEEGFRCLVRLWCWASQHRPKGVLTDMDPSDIAHASGWNGDPETWVKALLKVKWLDARSTADSNTNGTTGSIYELHDWREHQPYVTNGDRRKEQAKRAAEVRWGKRFSAGSNAERNAPPPTPTPTPVGGEGEEAPPLRSPDGFAAVPQRRAKPADRNPSILASLVRLTASWGLTPEEWEELVQFSPLPDDALLKTAKAAKNRTTLLQNAAPWLNQNP